MIRNATKKIADGDLKTRLEYISKDEIGELSQDINQMAQDLESSQEKLLKSEKLSVIGALAERMAHDIRNPLAIIMNAADQIKIKYKDNEESDFTIMNKAIKRISHQVQDVLDFVRSTPLLPEKVSLSSMLKQAIENEGIPEGIELVLPQGDLDLVCDRRKIEVVFANLIRNAVDAAMPRGKIQVRIADLNDKVRIEIEDSGQGISPENQARIFDPLFTTKQIGTGLGLTSVKNIVTEHGGTITFSTNPTIFAVEIPKMLY